MRAPSFSLMIESYDHGRKDISVFTARNRQNPFAKRRRAQAEAEQAQAVEFDRNPDSEEYVQAPDISTYETGGVVERDDTTHLMSSPANAERLREAVADVAAGRNLVEPTAEQLSAVVEISADTQAKIEAVMNKAIPPVADEQPAEAPAAEPESDAKRGRGRPRPQETIDRDNAVHALLVGADAETGISKESIAAELDEKEQQVYSSLRQLSKEGRAVNRYVKPHGYRWFAA